MVSNTKSPVCFPAYLAKPLGIVLSIHLQQSSTASRDRRTALGEWRFLANGVGPWFKNAEGKPANSLSLSLSLSLLTFGCASLHAGKPANSSFAPIFAAVNFTGQWRYVGDSPLLAGECGSLFPLPPLYPGTSLTSGAEAWALPTHVHKRGCGPSTCVSWGARGDHMTLGRWTDGISVDDPGTWTPLGPERTIDMGNVYAGQVPPSLAFDLFGPQRSVMIWSLSPDAACSVEKKKSP